MSDSVVSLLENNKILCPSHRMGSNQGRNDSFGAIRMASNGEEYLQMVGNGWEWLGTVANGLEWIEIVANG